MKSKIRFFLLAIFMVGLYMAGNCQAIFPLKWSADSRYLVDQNNIPFPILGRTAWFVISQPVSEYKIFLNNTVSHGCNAIEMHVLDHDPRGSNPPYNGNGDLPFKKRLDGSNWDGSLSYSNPSAEAPDLTTPNEQYWVFVDNFLYYCDSLGIVVFFFPAYLGYGGGDQGWMQELVANDTTRTKSYGAWIANRYKNQKNLVWMLLGDMGYFTPEQINAEAALITGLKSVTGQQSVQYSAEANSGQNSADQADFGNEMTLNGDYSWSGNVAAVGRNGYLHNPVLPAFLLEEPYDEEGPDGNSVNPYATQPVRRFPWWGFLSTLGGYIAGNGYIWPFNPNWQNHLNTPGALDMQRLNSFIQSITWWDLVPSGLNGMINLITSGGSTPSNTHYVAAAATSSGSLLVAYVPPAHNGSITVNMTAMSDSAQARWFDPTSGIYTTIPGSPFPNTGSQQFTPPGTNSGGKKDWVLILETMQSAACSVPTPHNTVKITATSAKLKWGITGTPTGFDARYKLTSSGTWLHKSVNIGTHKSVTLQNLQPSSEYEWQVSAKCDQQTSAYSSSLLFTTLPLKAGESLIALDNFLIYPKPASSILNIHSPADEELSKIFIYDIQGNTMEQTNFSNQINISGLQNGIFFLRIMDKEGNFVYTTKLIVQQ